MANTTDKTIKIPPVATVQMRLKDHEIEGKALQLLLRAAIANESRQYAANKNIVRRGGKRPASN